MRYFIATCTIAIFGLGCNALHTQKFDDLKVTRAIIYQNGIGYFERQGQVEGQEIKLRILPHQIADVLKSLTVVDLRTGRPVHVAMPVERTRVRQLADLPIQVRESGGLVSIAKAFRGARARVETKENAGEGRIVGVEQLSDSGDWRLSLLNDEGMVQCFDLTNIIAMQIQDRTLELGLRKALDVSLDEGSWKPVELSIHLAGEAPHQVLLSYVVDMPTWKPAYRVVLSKGQNEGLLQGWAVVDNVSGEDWNRITLSLTAGTPLTFTYDLYTPRYVQRPNLSPPQEAMAEAPPPPTDGAMAEAFEAGVPEEAQLELDETSRAEKKKLARPKRRALRAKESRPDGVMDDRPIPPPAKSSPASSSPAPAQMTSQLMEQSFRALVAGSRVGSLFRYDISEPITIRDRQSALVSIVNQRIPAEDILLFRIDASPTHPYRAVRLTNTTHYMLEKGPVAIYRDGNFVGEAVGGQVEANTSAFIPYSVDSRVIITLQDRTLDEAARLIKMHHGQMTCEFKQVSLHKYSIHNQRGEKSRLFIQREYRPGWKLTKPEKGVLLEKAHYFAPVDVAAKGKTDFEIREETPVRRSVSIFSQEGQQVIALYLKDSSADPKVSNSLREALALQEKLSKIEEELERLRREKNILSERQNQVRDNIKLLGKSLRNADLARKLTTTLVELESRLNEVTRNIVAMDLKRTEMRDRLTVIMQSITLQAE